MRGNSRKRPASAFLYAIEPLSVLYATKLLSETLFTARVTAFLYFLLRYLKRSAQGDLVAAAVALVASVYAGPFACFLPLIQAIGLAVRAGRGQGVKEHPISTLCGH